MRNSKKRIAPEILKKRREHFCKALYRFYLSSKRYGVFNSRYLRGRQELLCSNRPKQHLKIFIRALPESCLGKKFLYIIPLSS